MRKRASSTRGFSLIEISAVIVIMALLVVGAGTAAGYFRVLKRERVRSACGRLRNWLVRMRAVAMVRGWNVTLTYDLEENLVEVSGSAPGEGGGEGEPVRIRFGPHVRIREVSLDPYRTYVNGRVSVAVRRDGWVTPHLVYLGPAEGGDLDEKVYTVHVAPLGGGVSLFPERRGWDDFE